MQDKELPFCLHSSFPSILAASRLVIYNCLINDAVAVDKMRASLVLKG